jgi:fido (protein-threonine AMPylation protein)
MTMSYARIDPLLETIEAQRLVIDANLAGPARWRGPLRREGRHGPQPKERARYAKTFDRLGTAIASGTAPSLDADWLRGLHAGVFGGDGMYRRRGARVGGFVTTARAPAVPRLVDAALARAVDGEEEPVLAAARLQMELLLIHPWSDGNGRTARMAASALLMIHDFRSTLFTAVEQHSAVRPNAYARAFALLRSSEPTQQEPWLVTHLQLMAWSSELAAAYRLREIAMREALMAAGVDPGEHDALMVAYDKGEAAVDALVEFRPWFVRVRRMGPDKRRSLARQVERLVVEEETAA